MPKIKTPVRVIPHKQEFLRTADLVERYKQIPIPENTIVNWRREGNGPPWQRIGDAKKSPPIIYLMKDLLAWEKKHLAWFIPPERV